jgi:hypothetical protein
MFGGAAEVVEDHTHDPWSDWARTSQADYCLVSLRKTLPLPDGAAVWSPRRHPLPAQPPLSPEREKASLWKLGAMILKRLYLDGEAVDKQVFRQMQLAGEEAIARGPISGPSRHVEQLLPALPWRSWRRRRAQNHTALSDALGLLPGLHVLAPFSAAGACPLSVIMEFASPELREKCRAGLIAKAIYPAVLWPIEQDSQRSTPEAVRLSRRLLSLPCDFRYGMADLERVATEVRRTVLAP